MLGMIPNQSDLLQHMGAMGDSPEIQSLLMQIMQQQSHQGDPQPLQPDLQQALEAGMMPLPPAPDVQSLPPAQSDQDYLNESVESAQEAPEAPEAAEAPERPKRTPAKKTNRGRPASSGSKSKKRQQQEEIHSDSGGEGQSIRTGEATDTTPHRSGRQSGRKRKPSSKLNDAGEDPEEEKPKKSKRGGRGRKPDPSRGKKKKNKSEDEEEEEDDGKVYCCGEPYDESRIYIGCSNEGACQGFEWYHIDCVNLTNAVAKKMPSWYCDKCPRPSPGGRAGRTSSPIGNDSADGQGGELPPSGASVAAAIAAAGSGNDDDEEDQADDDGDT